MSLRLADLPEELHAFVKAQNAAGVRSVEIAEQVRERWQVEKFCARHVFDIVKPRYRPRTERRRRSREGAGA